MPFRSTGSSCLPALFVVTAGLLAQGGWRGEVLAETLKQPESLHTQLSAREPSYLARQARLRGDARRGALVFHTSAAGCVKCHRGGERATPLGPDLAKVGEVSDEHLIESLLHPSREMRPEYRTQTLLLDDGSVLTGLIAERAEQTLTLRSASDLTEPLELSVDSIERIKPSERSMMPDGLIDSLREQREFLDLVRYLIEIAAGGPERAAELKPAAEQLTPVDDSIDLDHAGIIARLRSRDFEAGQRIYHGYCFNCHGNDGNTPSLPTARAFGTDKLKFGSDPYRMFLTLTRGNGLMAPMTHLTPKERYQVVHYIRQQFMKPTNPDYAEVDQAYLSGLPEGTKDGTELDDIQRDYGPALGSQLRRDQSSVLTIRLGGMTVSYDLHTMDQAGLWRDGFLDLSQTQHARDRGEGTANPEGTPIAGLQGWRWGHDGRLDYPQTGVLPRGPLPEKWMRYRGYYRHGHSIVLRYEIDGRPVWETPRRMTWDNTIGHSLQLGPGDALVLAAAAADEDWGEHGMMAVPGAGSGTGAAGAVSQIAWIAEADQEASGDSAAASLGRFTAAVAVGQTEGLRWDVDDGARLRLRIPAEDHRRSITVIRHRGRGADELAAFADWVAGLGAAAVKADFETLTAGGPQLWPEVMTTTGYLGLERGAYALDTLTIPEETPWNTWFRTSALDFFADGRMAVATYGGDIWIVSGIDEQLTELSWKRFAAGLYEPFGLKIVDGTVYVTCKDRLTRLHDLNDDGEADFYESFSADHDVSVNFHAFNFDLQTDNEGNFYYAKSGHGSDASIPGAVIKVSPDGRRREVVCTGFRTPNGMGGLPDGRVTVSDNQGQWTPASKISVVRPGGFYGWVANYSLPGMWAPDGGAIDLETVVPPESFDRPMIWMPQEFDNSSGGQVWAGDSRFGPLSGRLLHTSFGKGWMYYTMMQEIGGTAQAAIVKLPFDFRTGIMRARVNPADGQVYACGLQGWNGGGRMGLGDNGIQRVRYTGRPHRMVRDCRVEPSGLKLEFNFPLDVDVATDPDSYQVRQWNYRWQKSYGSDMYSPSTGKPGIDPVAFTAVSLGADGRSVTLRVPDLQPVDQIHLIVKLKAEDGEPFEEEIYWTVNRVPEE